MRQRAYVEMEAWRLLDRAQSFVFCLQIVTE